MFVLACAGLQGFRMYLPPPAQRPQAPRAPSAASVQKRLAGELGSSRHAESESAMFPQASGAPCKKGLWVQNDWATLSLKSVTSLPSSTRFRIQGHVALQCCVARFRASAVVWVSGTVDPHEFRASRAKRGRSTGDPSQHYRAGKTHCTALLVNGAKQSAGGKKDKAQWRKGGVNYLGGWTVRDDPDSPKARVNGNVPLFCHFQ